ncbi:bifunctional riboflavin kinase/FAD synthetase [Pseudalkalibacillus caeni]|uniref:Riboflavin biosynthesis protein n=1 Tax=Exobacillus caeni TaxID=2574798 RepID=A0A5R9F9Z5_9BACL|nr:bifunctional riboflavin kinase/FAD synthetase [Pseudalkalibacillus caeni]TLS37374.1 bifunctional riboflavin kinase/FAD synthetase [Pseudalkalibacillus caeni]
MKTVYLKHPHDLARVETEDKAMALGYFDGIHLGHQKVILTAKEIAERKGYTSAVMTFHPHPSVVLGRSNPHVKYITPLDEKIKQIEKLGIDKLFIVTFDKTIANLTPQEFVDDYIIGLSVKHAVAGFDFTYGRKGSGTMETLVFHSRNQFEYTVVDKVANHNEKVSSTLIRSLINEGAVEQIPEYLGRFYEVKGTVVKGDQRGRTIGFPTANLAFEDPYLIPKTGVYAVKMKLGSDWHEGVCNIGYKPTFNESRPDEPTMEVHLFNFSQSIYNEQVAVKLCKRLRGERKFSSLDELKAQIKKDAENTKEYFSLKS